VTNTPVRLGSVEGGELVVVSTGGDLEVRDA
jgi:hypothetical protein